MNDYRKDIIEFYDNVAEEYKEERNELAEFTEIYNNFTKYLKPQSKI